MSVVARGEYTVSPLADGATGRGVSSVVSQYAVSTSKTTAPSNASFSTNRPIWEPGKYVWTRSLITYTSGSPATSTTTPIVSSEWEAVNEIQVGGRNLILNSTFQNDVREASSGRNTLINKSYNYLEYSTQPSVNAGYLFLFPEPLMQGEKYILSFDIECEENATFDYIILRRDVGSTGYGTQASKLPNQTIAEGMNSISIALNAPSHDNINGLWLGSNNSTTKIFILSNLKLERGNKATDWTPAPEDVDAKIDEVSQDVSGANEAIDQIISANATKQHEIDTRIDTLNTALFSLSAGVDDNNTSTQGAIDAIQAMIAALEAQRSALSDKVDSLERAKINTDNYIQIGNVKLSNGTTVFGVAIGKDVDILNEDGTISTFERSMTATTANEFMILTGGDVVGVFDATGMTSESVKVNKIVMGNRFAWSMTASNAMVLKKGG